MSSMFCCFGGGKDEATEVEARHNRIVSMYNGDNGSTRTVVMCPPPSYADIAQDRTVICSDEKDSTIFQPQARYPPEVRRASISSRSSIVSVPSTRLSDLTSMYTGATRRGRTRDGDRDNMSEVAHSRRSSGWYGSNDSAPPSYYAGSERGVTPTLRAGSVATAPSITAPTLPPPTHVAHADGFGVHHPVMHGGWLDSLQFEAERTHRAVRQCQDTCATNR